MRVETLLKDCITLLDLSQYVFIVQLSSLIAHKSNTLSVKHMLTSLQSKNDMKEKF